MELRDLINSSNVIIQIQWGDQKVEFRTSVLESIDKGILVNPYFHNGNLLELNVNLQSGVQCNVFGDNPKTRRRVSWKNVELLTILHNDSMVYKITTSNFNKLGLNDERRSHPRIVIHRPGELWDELEQRYVQIMIHDISDEGISFHAPSKFIPIGGNQRIFFTDYVKDDLFEIEIVCKIIRIEERMGTVFYGCQLAEENKDYLMYGCLRKLMQNSEDKKKEEENEENA